MPRVLLTFRNDAMAHSFDIETYAYGLEKLIRTWKPLGYNLSGYRYLSL